MNPLEQNEVVTVEEAPGRWSELLREIRKGRSFDISVNGEIVGVMGPPRNELIQQKPLKDSSDANDR
jgi:hypothetical protein